MHLSSVRPVNVPSDFKIGEMFFSTTDPRGIILTGNTVFSRVSGYTLEELVGQPHNIIRHPDMPRVIFRLLWDNLKAGRAVVALVKNMARDGRYYWVVALVGPVSGGYLSVRFKPSSPLSEKLQALYGRLREIEAEHGEGGADGRAGMDAAEKALGAELGRLGFADYGSFMWKYLHEEMKSRDARTGGMAPAVSAGTPGGLAGDSAVLGSIHQGVVQAYGQINALYGRLDELIALHERLAGKSDRVFTVTHNIRFVALSTTIKAAKLGEEGRGLEVIAQYLSDASARTSLEVYQLTGRIREIATELHAVIFNLAGARLQLEMMRFFVHELQSELAASGAVTATAGASRQEMILLLQKAFHATMTRAVEFLGTFGKHLAGLNAIADELRRTILTLQVAQLGGKVEASRIKDDDSIMVVLTEIHEHIGSTARELVEIGDITSRFAALIRAVPATAHVIDLAIDCIERDVRQLSTQRELAPAAAENPVEGTALEPVAAA